MWLLETLYGDLYNLPSAYRFRGPLAVDALRSALRELTDRHEMLRMRYVDVHGEVLQLPSSEPLDCPLVDLSGLPPAERDAELLCRTESDARTRFTLLGGPLVRTSVLRLAEDDHVLLLNLHHSIADGWSADLLFDQLEALYEDHLHSRPGAMWEPPTTSYLEYAARQRAWLESDAAKRSVDWWRGELAGASAELGLPVEAVEPGVPPGSGGVVSRSVPVHLAHALRALGRSEGATLFMVLLALYGLLLRRRYGRSDVMVGSHVSGRVHPDTETTVGLYANTTVFRVLLDGSATFRDLLAAVRRTALGVYAHQDLPFGWLVKQLEVPGVHGRNPLFSAFLSVESFSERPVRLAGLVGENVEAHTATAWYDLSLWIGEAPEGALRVDLTYAADRFAPGTAESLANGFLELLGMVVQGPEGRTLDELTSPDPARVPPPTPPASGPR